MRIPVAALVLTLVAAPAWAQANDPAPLPLAAQAAMKTGVLAAREQEWLIAIQSFQEARKTAPDAPEVFYNLGLAESRIPGRELRAIAWLGAYLAARPTAPNAAAVNEFVAGLQIKSRGNLSRLLTTMQDTATKLTAEFPRVFDGLRSVAELWAESGDTAAALKATTLIADAHARGAAEEAVAVALGNVGDRAGEKEVLSLALSTAAASGDPDLQQSIAVAQANSGDVATALKTAGMIAEAACRSRAQRDIAKAEVDAGDVAGANMTLAAALKSASLIAGNDSRINSQADIADVQTRAGDVAGARATLASALASAVKSKSDRASLYSANLMTIAKAQAAAGDAAAALRTADLVQDSFYHETSLRYIARLQAIQGDLVGALKTVSLIRDPSAQAEEASHARSWYADRAVLQPRIATTPSPTGASAAGTQAPVPVIRVSDWISRLDDSHTYTDCPLGTGPFVDLARHLQSVSASSDPREAFRSLDRTAETIVRAQRVIERMLQQQAKQ